MRNEKRPLSLRMVKNLHQGLRIPDESLLADVRSSRSRHQACRYTRCAVVVITLAEAFIRA